MRIICNNSFETNMSQSQIELAKNYAKTMADKENGMSLEFAFRLASRLVRCQQTSKAERRVDAKNGVISTFSGYVMLASIRAEIAPQIQALRHRQEVLESIGTRVNGGF